MSHGTSGSDDPVWADTGFAGTLAAGIIDRGLTLVRLVARLRAEGFEITPATLSNWQRGRTIPSRPSSEDLLGALDVILDFDRGTLWRLARADAVRATPSTDGTRRSDARRVALDSLGLADQGELSRITVLTRQTLTKSIHHADLELSTVWRCESGRARAGWVDVTTPPGSEGVVRAVSMCRADAPAVRLPDHRVIRRLDFPRPLLAGELIHTTVRIEEVVADEPWVRGAVYPLPAREQATLVIDFGRHQPRDLYYVLASATDGTELHTRAVSPFHGKVQAVRRGHASLSFGFRWAWPT